LREKHFAPYVKAVRAGALTVMVNSGSINGEPVHASYKLLTEWLKESLNWDGMIVTDWADIDNLWRREKVAKDKKEAIKIAINAGIDMSMDPYDLRFCTLLKELVEEGEVPMSRIDDATRRVLR
jgi:beta-glucosidase